MPPSKQPEPTFSRKKAARKVWPAEDRSDSSDSQPATVSSRNDDSGLDVYEGPSNRAISHHPPRARQILDSKSKRNVTFDVEDDTDSDETTATAREGSSQPRVQQTVPTQSWRSQSQSAKKVTKSGEKRGAARKSRASASGQFAQADIADDIPHKSTRGHDFRKIQVRKWGSKHAMRARNEGRSYARMSIGSAGGRGSSRSTNIPQQDRRRRWFLHRGNIGSHGRHGTSHHKDANAGKRYDEDLSTSSTQKAAKSIRKSENQSARKRILDFSPSPASDGEVVHDINDAFHYSDVGMDEPADLYLTDSSENDEAEVTEHTEPSQTLLDRLEHLSLNVVRLHKMRRLPFLHRNLRKGFQLRCRMAGVDTRPQPLPRTAVSVVYSSPLANGPSCQPEESRTTTAKSSMNDWSCPLCDLHMKFDNAGMLDKHLEWDHSSVKVLWDEHYTMLSLTIPDSQPKSNAVISRRAPTRELSATELSSDPGQADKNTSVDPDEKPVVRTSSTPSGVTSESGFGVGAVSTMPSTVEGDLKPKYDTPECSQHVGTDSESRSNSVSGRSASQSLLGADTREGLGPSAVAPYLLEVPDENGDVYYSCRPGGPRLFDILNTLSLKPFGVLKWVILDREEELFEVDDILDEDKVIQALWYRWIFLNRNKFVANYFNGTKTFIRENWELIKQGAGLLALRTWLLVLLVNNFLLPTEVATLMRYYQELADIQL